MKGFPRGRLYFGFRVNVDTETITVTFYKEIGDGVKTGRYKIVGDFSTTITVWPGARVLSIFEAEEDGTMGFKPRLEAAIAGIPRPPSVTQACLPSVEVAQPAPVSSVPEPQVQMEQAQIQQNHRDFEANQDHAANADPEDMDVMMDDEDDRIDDEHRGSGHSRQGSIELGEDMPESSSCGADIDGDELMSDANHAPKRKAPLQEGDLNSQKRVRRGKDRDDWALRRYHDPKHNPLSKY